jgi:hypothetical protein
MVMMGYIWLSPFDLASMLQWMVDGRESQVEMGWEALVVVGAAVVVSFLHRPALVPTKDRPARRVATLASVMAVVDVLSLLQWFWKDDCQSVEVGLPILK